LTGRPSNFDPAKCAKIIEYVLAGNPLKVAAQAVGVPKATMNFWRKLGRDYLDAVDTGKTPNPAHEQHAEFYLAVDQAKGEQVVNLNAKLNDNETRNINAHMWRMQVLRPDIYGDKTGRNPLNDRIAEANRMREAREAATYNPQLGSDLDAMAERMSGSLGEP